VIREFGNIDKFLVGYYLKLRRERDNISGWNLVSNSLEEWFGEGLSWLKSETYNGKIVNSTKIITMDKVWWLKCVSPIFKLVEAKDRKK
jgi:hypothetical protein